MRFYCKLKSNIAVAESPDDYLSLTVILTFPACETRACEEVTIIDDDILETTESFNATLTRTPNLDPRITLDPFNAVVIILDNDGRSPIMTPK